MAILPSPGVLPLPGQYAVRGGAFRRSEHPQAQHLVASRQRSLPIEAPVAHLAPEFELGSRRDQRGPERVGVVHPRLDLELVRGRRRGRAHAKIASRTAAVSANVSNTYVAPLARSAAASYKPVATATLRAPIDRPQATSSGVSPTMTTSAPANRRPVRTAARAAATCGRQNGRA